MIAPRVLRWWPGLALVALVVAASCYNLANYPVIWWDEAIFSETAANLVQHGRYAFTIQTPDQLSDLDYRISVGPALILPVALAYRLFGVSLTVGRVVAALYLILTFGALFLCIRRLWDQKTAFLAVILALVATDVLYWGRSVLGDIPALGLFLMGTWLIVAGMESRSLWPLFGGGIFLGLAFDAKEFYGIGFLPPLVLLFQEFWGDRRLLRRSLMAWGAGLALPLAGYLLLKVAILGSFSQAVAHFLEQKALLRHEFFTPLTIGRIYPESVAYLLGHPLFWLGVLGFYWLWRVKGLSVGHRLWLGNFLVWSLLYLTAVYWHRFALPALFLAAGPAAWTVRRVGAGLLAPVAEATRRRVAGALASLAALLFLPLAGIDNLTGVLSTHSNAPSRMLEFLQVRVPCESLIETPEYELAFLDDDHRIHLMPAFYFVESTEDRVVLLNPRMRQYDFDKTGADLLILGSFGKSVFRQVYNPAQVAKNWQKVATVDFYDVYVRRGRENLALRPSGPLLVNKRLPTASGGALQRGHGAAPVDNPYPH
jgi:hypothetical protein